MQKLIYIFWLFLCPTVIFSQANISGEINIPKPKGLSLYLKENIGGHYHTMPTYVKVFKLYNQRKTIYYGTLLNTEKKYNMKFPKFTSRKHTSKKKALNTPIFRK
ncbi:MAG: hypothetical protein B7C24_01440 [Bacteroidetes bacterium 4572_77]|nr:MAG: hypothetical protein B7C24_01440 [Bacteroidetes bacterium 4572_77]